MFPQKQRLNSTLFEKIFKLGKSEKTTLFLLKYKKNNLEKPRFSVVIPKKNIKLATKRNLLKRKFLGAIKKSEILNEKMDFIFILNKNLENLKQKEIILILDKLRLK